MSQNNISNTFPAEGSLLNFLKLGNGVPFHFMLRGFPASLNVVHTCFIDRHISFTTWPQNLHELFHEFPSVLFWHPTML
jgi:hypothetical protein